MKNFIYKILHIENSQINDKTFLNTFWLVLERLFSLFIGLFVTSSIARYYGVTLYGVFNYSYSFVMIFVIFSTLGLDSLTIKALLKGEYHKSLIMGTSFVLKLIGGITALFIILILNIIVNDVNSIESKLTIILSVILLMKSFDVFEFWLQSMQLGKITSVIKMITYIIISSMKLIIVFFRMPIIFLAYILVFDTIIIATLYVLTYSRFNSERIIFRINLDFAREIMREAIPIIISGLMVTLYSKTDQFMLGLFFPDKYENGLYSAAINISTLWFFIPMALIVSYKPLILRNDQENHSSNKEKVRELYRLIIILGVLFGIFVTLFSKIIINVVYGDSYSGSSLILIMLTWSSTFAVLGTASSLIYTSMRIQKYQSYIIIYGAVINIILNLYLIPLFGAIGAALATLFTQFFVCIIGPVFFKSTRFNTKLLLFSFKRGENENV